MVVHKADVKAGVVGHEDVVANEGEELLQGGARVRSVFQLLGIDVGEILDEFRHLPARTHQGGKAFRYLTAPEADGGQLDQFVFFGVQARGLGVEGHKVQFFAQRRDAIGFQMSSGSVIFPVQIVAFEFLDQSLARDAQFLRGLGLVPVRGFHGLQDHVALQLFHGVFEGFAAGEQADRFLVLHVAAHLVREIQGPDESPVPGQGHGPLDLVFQLAHVARPFILLQHLHSVVGEALHVFAHAGVVFVQEMDGQQRDVAGAELERGHLDADHVQAVIEVQPEIAGAHLFLQGNVGGANHADVYLFGFGGAHALDLAFLKEAEQLGLGALADVGDLVQKKGAAVGDLEEAFLVVGGAGEGAFHVAEEFAFQQGFRQSAAILGHEGLVAPVAAVVQGPGDQLLAGAAGAFQQHGGGGVLHLFDDLEDLQHFRAFADDIGVEVAGVELFADGGVGLFQAGGADVFDDHDRLVAQRAQQVDYALGKVV